MAIKSENSLPVLVFATNNQHKLREVQQILENKFVLKTLADIDCFEELPETQDSIEGNALQKASYLYEKFYLNCFADDTGLEIEALNGEPGVKSARYAGEERNNEKNIDLVLQNLSNTPNRNARFKTVISLIFEGNRYQFTGIVNGQLTMERRGSNGFGYDSIFVPDGFSKTFAELEQSEKNAISHRSIAFKKLILFLMDQP